MVSRHEYVDIENEQPSEADVEDFMLSYKGLKNLGNTCFFNSTM